MPKVNIELSNQDIKELTFKTKKGVAEAIVDIIQQYLKGGIRPESLVDDKRFIRTLEEILNGHLGRLTKRIEEVLKSVDKSDISKEDILKLSKELDAIKKNIGKAEIDPEYLKELEMKFEVLRNGVLKEIDTHRLRIAKVIDKERLQLEERLKELERKLVMLEEQFKKLERYTKQGIASKLGEYLNKTAKMEKQIVDFVREFDDHIKFLIEQLSDLKEEVEKQNKKISYLEKKSGILQCSATHGHREV